jgi:hypothetical protein
MHLASRALVCSCVPFHALAMRLLAGTPAHATAFLPYNHNPNKKPIGADWQLLRLRHAGEIHGVQLHSGGFLPEFDIEHSSRASVNVERYGVCATIWAGGHLATFR